jgi:hypothetical protein
MARRSGSVGSPLTIFAPICAIHASRDVARERYRPYTAISHPGGRTPSAKPAIVKSAAAEVSRGYTLARNTPTIGERRCLFLHPRLD